MVPLQESAAFCNSRANFLKKKCSRASLLRKKSSMVAFNEIKFKYLVEKYNFQIKIIINLAIKAHD